MKDLHEIYKSQNPNFESIINTSMVSATKPYTGGPLTKDNFFFVEEDRRLPLFGYNVEVLSMLLLPMIKNS
jgi:hypothetical protein